MVDRAFYDSSDNLAIIVNHQVIPMIPGDRPSTVDSDITPEGKPLVSEYTYTLIQ